LLRRNRNRPPRHTRRGRYPGLSPPRSLLRLALSGGGLRRCAFRGSCLGYRSLDPRGGRAADGRVTERRAAPGELAAALCGPVDAQVAAAASSAIDFAEIPAALACALRLCQAVLEAPSRPSTTFLDKSEFVNAIAVLRRPGL
jgi:hypothetical protein